MFFELCVRIYYIINQICSSEYAPLNGWTTSIDHCPRFVSEELTFFPYYFGVLKRESILKVCRLVDSMRHMLMWLSSYHPKHPSFLSLSLRLRSSAYKPKQLQCKPLNVRRFLFHKSPLIYWFIVGVVVGDGAVGKVLLVQSFLAHPSNSIPSL